VKPLVVACLLLVACKEESKPAEQAKPAEATKVERGRGPAPALPDTPEHRRGDRPRLPEQDADEQPRDWSDPAAREEMRARMEERRKRREAALDTNKDGVVSTEERQARLKPMIERFDQNDDGKLTVEELASSDRRMGFDDPAAIDTDKNGEISLGELDAAITQRRNDMRARWRGRNGGSADGVGPD
jgi:type IV secretory pathway VirB10-like protein